MLYVMHVLLLFLCIIIILWHLLNRQSQSKGYRPLTVPLCLSKPPTRSHSLMSNFKPRKTSCDYFHLWRTENNVNVHALCLHILWTKWYCKPFRETVKATWSKRQTHLIQRDYHVAFLQFLSFFLSWSSVSCLFSVMFVW